MKILGYEVPQDGLAVSLAVYWLSPQGDKIRNTLVVAALHGFLHPREVHHEIEEFSTQASNVHNVSINKPNLSGEPIKIQTSRHRSSPGIKIGFSTSKPKF